MWNNAKLIAFRRRQKTTLRLLMQFGVASLIPMLVLGWVLSSELRTSMNDRSLRIFANSSTQTTNMMVDVMQHQINGPVTNNNNLGPAIAAILDSMSETQNGVSSVRFVDIFDRVVYSTDAKEMEEFRPPDPLRTRARTGETQAKWISASLVKHPIKGTRYYDMYVPIALRGLTVGTLEVRSAAKAVQALTEQDVTKMRVLLGLGLFCLWLSLVPIVSRVSQRLARQADENETLALRDALTGLNNRAFFLRDGAKLLERNPVSGLILIDLNNFKDINDTLGHQAGDALLCHIASQLKSHTRNEDIVVRLGGDEFAILLPGLSMEALMASAERISSGIGKSTIVKGIVLNGQGAIGLAVSPENGVTIDELFQRADIAMYASKERNAGPVAYSADIDLHSPSKLALTGELRQALTVGDQIRLAYQPIVDAQNGRVVGAEALGRWYSPKRGLISPLDFITLAERSGLIRDYTEYAVIQAAQQYRSWKQDGIRIPISINLSSKNFHEEDLAERLQAIMFRFGIPASEFTLEVTESGLVEQTEETFTILKKLRAMGFQIALDDFGTGYSSLTYLRTLNANVLKIDQSFIRGIDKASADTKIVHSVIQMARGLNMSVVAEGVELESQRDLLVEFGCDRFQGYLFSKPVSAEEMPALVQRLNSNMATAWASI